MLKESTKADLVAELQRLGAAQSRIARKVEALQLILATEQKSVTPVAPVRDSITSSENDFANGKARAARIRTALRSFNRPARPQEVAAFLEKQGEKSKGETAFHMIVGGELYRMAKRQTGGVINVSRGLYEIRGENRKQAG
jgi:hypothetical protein